MSAPKQIKRAKRTKERIEYGNAPNLSVGPFRHYLSDTEYLSAIGKSIVAWNMAEATAVHILRFLLGDVKYELAQELFHSLISQSTRIPMMRNLLQNTDLHENVSNDVDDLLDRFAALNSTRNAFVHGYWMTQTKTGKVFLAPHRQDPQTAIVKRREVPLDELRAFHDECLKLREDILFNKTIFSKSTYS